jgi:penicillin-binding protein 1A
MKKVTGGSLPAELWHDVMLAAHKDKRPKALPSPRGPGMPWEGSGAVAQRILPFFDGPNAANRGTGRPLFQRVMGFFGGG